jgi:hypothetical protein
VTSVKGMFTFSIPAFATTMSIVPNSETAAS